MIDHHARRPTRRAEVFSARFCLGGSFYWGYGFAGALFRVQLPAAARQIHLGNSFCLPAKKQMLPNQAPPALALLYENELNRGSARGTIKQNPTQEVPS